MVWQQYRRRSATDFAGRPILLYVYYSGEIQMNILILSASTGGGHNRAANALKEYIRLNDPETNVDIIDAIEECSSVLNFTVVKGYETMVKVIPGLFGAIYKSTDKKSPAFDMVNGIFQQCSRRLKPIIESYEPDVIISCHPFAGSIAGYMKTHYDYHVPLISIVTDFLPHRSYISDGVDVYVTASQKAKEMMSENYGVDGSRVYDYGHPVFESFYEGNGKSREETLGELGFSLDKPTALIMAGSFGVSDILKIYESLVGIDLDCQFIVITGRNKKLYNAFEELLEGSESIVTEEEPEMIRNLSQDNVLRTIYESSEGEKVTSTFKPTAKLDKPTKLFYFVDNVDDYMHASDLIITKPGGLTASESIACALPMAVFKAIPGQEEQNAEYLVENDIGMVIENGEDAAEKVGALLNDRERLRKMRESCRKYVRKNSCRNIYELARTLATKKKED